MAARTLTSLSALSGGRVILGIGAGAAAAGRDPAQIVDVYNFGGRITPEPLAATRGEDGRWIGGSVQQWVDELTTPSSSTTRPASSTATPTTPRRRSPGPLGHRGSPRRP
jgi:hypothetical protein